MTLRAYPDPIGSPDDTTPIVGGEGLAVLQESGQLVVRTGVTTEQRDYDIESESITDQTDVPIADPADIGSTKELSGMLESDQDNPFSVAVVWQADDNSTELSRQDLGSDTAFKIEALTTKSDHAAVLVTDESAAGTGNTITGTLNFH